jgi:hypothetical protein
MIVGRKIVRSATSASTIANALNQPNSRNDERPEKRVTTRQHESTTEIRLRGGPMSTLVRSRTVPGAWRSFFEAQSAKKMDSGAQARSQRGRQRHCRPSLGTHDNVSPATPGNIAGVRLSIITMNEQKGPSQ